MHACMVVYRYGCICLYAGRLLCWYGGVLVCVLPCCVYASMLVRGVALCVCLVLCACGAMCVV